MHPYIELEGMVFELQEQHYKYPDILTMAPGSVAPPC